MKRLWAVPGFRGPRLVSYNFRRNQRDPRLPLPTRVVIPGAMKVVFAHRAVLIGIFLTVLCACATRPRSGLDAVAGSWTNRLSTVWALNSDGTFEVDLDHDGKRDAWGTYAVNGDVITIMGTGGMSPKGCKGNGVYRFGRGRDTLRFTRVSDKCNLRVRNVTLLWHRR